MILIRGKILLCFISLLMSFANNSLKYVLDCENCKKLLMMLNDKNLILQQEDFFTWLVGLKN